MDTYHELRAEGLPFSAQYQSDRAPVLDPGAGSLLDRPGGGGGGGGGVGGGQAAAAAAGLPVATPVSPRGGRSSGGRVGAGAGGGGAGSNDLMAALSGMQCVCVCFLIFFHRRVN